MALASVSVLDTVDKSLKPLAIKMDLREGCDPGWTSFCMERVHRRLCWNFWDEEWEISEGNGHVLKS